MITRVILTIGMLLTFALSPASGALALEAGEVLVVANTAVSPGIKLASYYMKQRGIPEDNIVRVSLPDEETISRKQYDEKIAAPVLKALKALEPRRRIRCLLLMYGMPLRVAAPEISPDDKKLIATLQQRREETRRLIDALPAGAKEEKERLAKDLAAVDAEIANAKKSDHSASVDSEIALVAAGSYPLTGWVPNPFFLGNLNKELAVDKSRVLMVSRLDGPSEKIVRRIIDDSLAAEREGLSGTAYFDARWPEPAAAPKGGYEFYDGLWGRPCFDAFLSRQCMCTLTCHVVQRPNWYGTPLSLPYSLKKESLCRLHHTVSRLPVVEHRRLGCGFLQ